MTRVEQGVDRGSLEEIEIQGAFQGKVNSEEIQEKEEKKGT